MAREAALNLPHSVVLALAAAQVLTKREQAPASAGASGIAPRMFKRPDLIISSPRSSSNSITYLPQQFTIPAIRIRDQGSRRTKFRCMHAFDFISSHNSQHITSHAPRPPHQMHTHRPPHLVSTHVPAYVSAVVLDVVCVWCAARASSGALPGPALAHLPRPTS